jgi:CHASE3 domain sensor protein
MQLLALIRKNPLIYPAMLVLLLISINTAIVYYNNWILKKTNADKEEAEKALLLVTQVWDEVVRNVDIGARGFALGKTEVLLTPMNDALRNKPVFFQQLRDVTQRQGFQNTYAIDSIELAIDSFIAATKEMVRMVREDKMDQYMAAMNADPGRYAWYVFSRNSRTVTEFEERLHKEAIASYENANFRTVIVQTVLFVVALPTLLFMMIKIGRDAKARAMLFEKLETNNRNFLFDPGTKDENLNGDQVIENSIRNFHTATNFIREVSTGNFAVQWQGIAPGNERLNQKNLAGELIQMRDRMKTIKQQDDIRNWTSDGLAKFSEIVRGSHENIEALAHHALMFITKYLKAQQGAMFVVNKDDNENEYLNMVSCYAFSRKKYLDKKIEIGQGLVGQVYLEGRTVLLTQVPHGYTQITSGLGESTPDCLLIVPFKHNERTEAVIELAGFRKFERHEVDFMEKVGEIVASALSSVRNTETMKGLLKQFQTQTEQLRAQEEELRQNMEEMEATQEAYRRAEKV